MKRAVPLLLAVAALACFAAVPLLFVDDAAPPAPAPAREARPASPALLAFARAIPAAQLTQVTEEQASVGPLLVALDRAFEDGVRKCAPEMWDFDRRWLERLQGDWLQIKPNMTPSWQAWLSLDGVVLDERRVEECRAIFSGEDCLRMRDAWDPCTTPFTGALGEGAACEAHEQCMSSRCVAKQCTAPGACMRAADCGAGMVCSVSGDDETTACVAAPAEGDECIEVHDDPLFSANDGGCAPGLACSNENRCRVPRQVGEACGLDAPCGGDAWCDDAGDEGRDEAAEDEREAPRVCRRDSPEEGNVALDCDPERDGKYCVEGAEDECKRCADVEIVPLGAKCDQGHMCADSLGVTACIDGRCERALGSGDACTDHDNCKDDLVCIAGACSAPLHAGEPCTHFEDCIFGLECITLDDGSVCDVPRDFDDSYDHDELIHDLRYPAEHGVFGALRDLGEDVDDDFDLDAQHDEAFDMRETHHDD